MPRASEMEGQPQPGTNERANVPLGTLIFRAGLLSEEQLEEALSDAINRGKRLGQVLLERGLLKEEDLARLLADQRRLPFVRLSEYSIDPTAADLVPREAAWLNHALPIGFDDGIPVIAIDDPTDDVAMRNVRSLVGREPRFVVATRSEILGRLAPAGDAPPDEPPPPPPRPAASPPRPAAPAAIPGTGCRVVVRLANGDRVEVGAFESAQRAEDEARSVIRRLAMTSASEWPFYAGRFIRPENIVSVDLVEETTESSERPTR